MIRRTALKLLVSLSSLSLVTANISQHAYAGSDGGGSSSGGSSSSGGDSSSGGSSSSSGGGSSPSGGGSSLRDDGGSSPNSPSGPDDSLSGSSANDSNSQNELVTKLNQQLQDDGLQTVSPDNLESTLDSFK